MKASIDVEHRLTRLEILTALNTALLLLQGNLKFLLEAFR